MRIEKNTLMLIMFLLITSLGSFAQNYPSITSSLDYAPTKVKSLTLKSAPIEIGKLADEEDSLVDTKLFINKYFTDSEVKSTNFNGEHLNIIKLKKRGTFALTEKYYCAKNGEAVIPNLNFGDVTAFGSIIGLNAVALKIYLDRNRTPTKDKVLHAVTGYNIGAFGTGLAQLVLPKKMKRRRLVAFLSGAGLAILAGIAKEVKDSDGSGNVELLDAVATSAGGIAGAATFSFTDIKRIFSKNKRKDLDRFSYDVSDLERLQMEVDLKNENK